MSTLLFIFSAYKFDLAASCTLRRDDSLPITSFISLHLGNQLNMAMYFPIKSCRTVVVGVTWFSQAQVYLLLTVSLNI